MTFRIYRIAILLSFISASYLTSTSAQPGLRFYDDRAMDGYTLYQSENSAVLINNCGELINEWTGVSARLHVKLQPNGNIIYIENFSEKIIEKDWDDNTVNEIEVQSGFISPDYEVILMENGNYLTVGRRQFMDSQFENIGYNYGQIGFPSQVDVVMELERTTGEIVWLWDISDHVIQERDSAAPNFGDISEHPELLNMDAISTYDWTFEESFMINGFDYNQELDQIALSVRKMSEIVIIDHSTTTAEAAGHTGGNSGKGGDILYRWGNPQNYGRGTTADRKLWFQHNPNWIKYGPHAGKLIAYNNGLSGPLFSTAPIINTPVDANGNYTIEDGQSFGPDTPDVEYGNGLGEGFFSGYTSAAKVLPTGNILITVGGSDRVFEMLPDGTLVWDYKLYQAGLTFRSEKYALDYPAFVGRDLTPGDVLEFPPSTVECDIVDNVSDTYFNSTRIWMTENVLKVESDLANELALNLYDIDGKFINQFEVKGSKEINLSELGSGIYLVQLKDVTHFKSKTYKVFR